MLTEICVDAVLAIKPSDEKTPLDLHMIELMEMQHRSEQVKENYPTLQFLYTIMNYDLVINICFQAYTLYSL
jgi:hypothetical protein